MHAIKKQGEKSVLIPHTRVKNSLPQGDIKTAASMCQRCCYCISDNVAFANENMNKTFVAIKI